MAGWQGCSTEIPKWMQRSLRRNGKSAFDEDDFEDRIAGGPIALEPIPWQAHLTMMIGSEAFQCGGTILDEETILTAAHCLNSKQLGPIKVETGVLANPVLERNFDINEKTSNVKKVIVYPNFEAPTKGDDIAILKLKMPLTFDNDTKPACLPKPSFSPEDRELGIVSGWGRISSRGRISDVLRYVSIPLVKNTDCSNMAPRYKSILKDTMLCAGRREGKIDSCKGDSGGPLIVGGTSSSIEEENDYFDYDLSALGAERATSTTDSNIAIIYGIVSFGPKRCGQPKVSGVYTRVTKYLPWISSLMKDTSSPTITTTMTTRTTLSTPTASSELPSQCLDYQILNATSRNRNYGYGRHCDGSGNDEDWKGPGWYRMMNPAGSKIPEKPPHIRHCGTYNPGWMYGVHPSQHGETQEREICFNWNGKTCDWKTTITVINCKDYFVYNLPKGSWGYPCGRYCAE